MNQVIFIIDDELLCSGSFNWTSQATGNNDLIIELNLNNSDKKISLHLIMYLYYIYR
jgi:hypothetical protein